MVPRRAVLAGLVATLSALAGYCVMTLTPVEGVHVTADPGAIVALLRSEDVVIAASVITGPLYGFWDTGGGCSDGGSARSSWPGRYAWSRSPRESRAT